MVKAQAKTKTSILSVNKGRRVRLFKSALVPTCSLKIRPRFVEELLLIFLYILHFCILHTSSYVL